MYNFINSFIQRIFAKKRRSKRFPLFLTNLAGTLIKTLSIFRKVQQNHYPIKDKLLLQISPE